ncbi:glycine/betaine ABC transporter [Sporosarcina sp. resist]|uniref:glycine betaine ABC transporter substrate-binding protein n=1 Tax=Sporosarcina TaxID=1569 RepID=UPI00078E1FB0|nr:MULTISPECIES: glycine betaine ABC transporter substrate-binding protein [Sporosarcina]AMQ05646.1 glycine/betaine ABC transporter [Sporosarcina psychrophila]QNK89537.1 glycine/betaine ABC transporter [Sporosarcina sp. resist]
MKLTKKVLGLGAVALLAVGLAACGSDKNEADGDSTKTVGESVDYKITGIDPGAGIMEATEKVLTEYDLTDWDLTTGSSAAMTASLKKAYDKEQPIIVTGWTPHWKFAKYDLKYLEDPKGVYGGEEQIRTIGRIGLAEDLPEAHQILSKFNWTEEDMGEIMVAIQEGEKEDAAAQKWVEANEEKVAVWTEGVEKVDGDKIKLAYVAWDSEIASHNVMKIVLEDMGYKVTLTQVEAGPLWTAVADGSADASLAAWMPLTHKTYADKFEGKFEELGVNMEGVKVGLVVPKYMDIDSIEDLKK